MNSSSFLTSLSVAFLIQAQILLVQAFLCTDSNVVSLGQTQPVWNGGKGESDPFAYHIGKPTVVKDKHNKVIDYLCKPRHQTCCEQGIKVGHDISFKTWELKCTAMY
ncbi:hypothetical protein KEM48_002121 [Puccinia striiformis f. sp. tritici PST-130]|nr:hypothetical protein KEM48_002121 [Puccinia striiformis f. sp. tritici PST-130]